MFFHKLNNVNLFFLISNFFHFDDYDDNIYSMNFSSSEPVPTILGGPDLFVDKGSTINLTCTIRFGSEPHGHIFWKHEDKVSEYFKIDIETRGKKEIKAHTTYTRRTRNEYFSHK